MSRRTKQILGAVKTENGRSYWTRIGTAFENSDSSWNLVFHYIPLEAGTTIQLREIRAGESAATEGLSTSE